MSLTAGCARYGQKNLDSVLGRVIEENRLRLEARIGAGVFDGGHVACKGNIHRPKPAEIRTNEQCEFSR